MLGLPRLPKSPRDAPMERGTCWTQGDGPTRTPADSKVDIYVGDDVVVTVTSVKWRRRRKDGWVTSAFKLCKRQKC